MAARMKISTEALKARRMARGWTIPQLSRRSTVAKSVIYRLESGETCYPYLPTLMALAKALRTDVPSLLEKETAA